jgi:hypothetical protein
MGRSSLYGEGNIMKSRYLLAGLAATSLLALSFPAAADQVKGVVKNIDLPGDMFIIETDDNSDPLTFTVSEGTEFEDFIGDIEVGDEVMIEFDPDFCGDNPDCVDPATDIEEL